jgi:hypothetical protein
MITVFIATGIERVNVSRKNALNVESIELQILVEVIYKEFCPSRFQCVHLQDTPYEAEFIRLYRD